MSVATACGCLQGNSPRCAPQRCAKEGKELSVCVVEKGAEVGAPALQLPALMQLWVALLSEHGMGWPFACTDCRRKAQRQFVASRRSAKRTLCHAMCQRAECIMCRPGCVHRKQRFSAQRCEQHAYQERELATRHVAHHWDRHVWACNLSGYFLLQARTSCRATCWSRARWTSCCRTGESRARP